MNTLVAQMIGRRQKIRVMGEWWKIEWVRRDDDRGECDEVGRIIRLDPERSRCEDLLHEVIHAIEIALQLDCKKEDEQWVQGTARGLWCVCQDNPWFVTTYLGGSS